MNPPDIKSQLIGACLMAAAADLQGVQSIDGVPVNATSNFSDPGQQKKNVLVYETAKVYYAAALMAYEDQTGVWPNPPAAAAGPGGAPASPAAAISALTRSPVTAIAAAATALLSALQSQPQGTAPVATTPAAAPATSSAALPAATALPTITLGLRVP